MDYSCEDMWYDELCMYLDGEDIENVEEGCED